MRAYNFEFNLIKCVMESLVGNGHDLGDTSFNEAGLLGVMAFGISEDLSCLQELLVMSTRYLTTILHEMNYHEI